MENRRQFSRILFSTTAQLTVGEEIYPVSLLDISLNGALVSAIKAKESLVGKLGLLNFTLAENEAEVVMHIAIVHEHENETGLQCNAIGIDSVTHLRRLVELNLGDSEQLNKELDQLSH